MLRRVMCSVAAVLALVSAQPAAQAQVFNQGPWSGLYLGLHGGYGWVSDTTPSANGWAGGLQAGYNLQLGSALLGVEADYTWSDLAGSGSISGLPVSSSIDSMWSIRGRLGWTVTPNVLLFGTAGYGGFDASVRTVVNGLSLAGTASFDGLVVGGGAEMLLTRNLLLRAEGLHYMGEGSGIASGAVGDVTILRAAVSYKF